MSKKKYYIIEGNVYINRPFNTGWFSEDGIEIHARKDVYFNDFDVPEKLEDGDVFLDIDKLGFPVKEVVAYSTKSYFEGELINS